MALIVGNRYRYTWPEQVIHTDKGAVSIPPVSFVFLIESENTNTYVVRSEDKEHPGYFIGKTINLPKGGTFEQSELITTSLD